MSTFVLDQNLPFRDRADGRRALVRLRYKEQAG